MIQGPHYQYPLGAAVSAVKVAGAVAVWPAEKQHRKDVSNDIGWAHILTSTVTFKKHLTVGWHIQAGAGQDWAHKAQPLDVECTSLQRMVSEQSEQNASAFPQTWAIWNHLKAKCFH